MPSHARSRPRTRSVPLRLEALEDRLVPTFTYGGGPLLSSVAIQGLYLGSDWSNTSVGNANPAPTSYFDGFLKYLVNSPYMDMLNKAGYQVGRGTSTAGVIDPVTLTKGSSTTYLQDSTIQADLQQEITAGKLQSPGPNNVNDLYVVFVEDNVPVQTVAGAASNAGNGFAAYHSMFVGTDSSGNPANIYYAVIPVPGGTVGNNYTVSGIGKSHDATVPHDMTIAASNEIAEAVTDPVAGTGWYDLTTGSEIGAPPVGQYGMLHNYAVQRLADQNDQAMTPQGAAALKPMSFVLESSGKLYEYASSTNAYLIATNVAAITNQSIGADGRAIVDYVDTSGNAWTYDDYFKVATIRNQNDAEQAVNAQGVDYLLLTNGQLIARTPPPGVLTTPGATNWTTAVLAANVASLSAGTDPYGVSCVDFVTTSGAAYEYSLSTGLHLIKSSGVASVSAGQLGLAGLVLTTGEGDIWQESTNNTMVLASSGVAQVTVGSDAKGNPLVERLDTSGNLWEYQKGLSGTPTEIKTGVAAISNARVGRVDAILTNGTAALHSDGTGQWTMLDSNPVSGIG